MKYRMFALFLLLGIGMTAAAEGEKAAGDTLTRIAAKYATVGRVKVSQVKETPQEVQVYTNSALSWLSLSPGLVDSLRGAAAAVLVPDGKKPVRIYSEGHELAYYITSIHLSPAQEKKQAHYTLPAVRPLTENISRPYPIRRGLEGKHIALYGSHGIYYHQAQERWIWQRARMFTTVEDLYTTSYTMPFLVPMLENAGAVVIQPRERDRQTNEVIVDDRDIVAEGWTQADSCGWGAIPDGLLYEGENPFTFGGYLFRKTSNEAMPLRYTPDIPEAGDYAVYISYKTLPASTDAARYSVMHDGVRTDYRVNQQMGGGTWIYLGTFHFTENANENYVEVSGKGRMGKVVTSDAIRFGGGMGSIARYSRADYLENVPSAKENGGSKGEGPRVFPAREEVEELAVTSGVPRWLEGSRYWFQYSGIPDSVYDYTGGKNDYTDDYASRGRWMNWLIGGSAAYPKGPGLHIPVEMGMAFHTDAGTTLDNEIVGTLAIYTSYDDDRDTIFPTGKPRTLCRDYADYIQTQLVNDVRATFAPEWTRRRLHNSSYAESRNPKIPIMLLEFLSHQNFADMKYGLDPSFRFVVSRAIYKAMLRFNHEQYGTPYVVQPLPVERFAIRFANDNRISISWAGRLDSLEKTAAPKAYVLYTRVGGADWDNGRMIAGTDTVLAIREDTDYDFKVCAWNEGGISFPSEVLSACKVSSEKGKVLIVNGFTRVSGPDHFESRDSTYGGFLPSHYGVGYMAEVNYIGEQYEFDRSLPWMSDDHSGFGASYNNMRSVTPVGNTFNYPCLHGRALREMGYSYVSSSVAAIDSLQGDYDLVDLILGKQKTTKIGTEQVMTKYPVFPQNLRKALLAYRGNILVSGAYVGTDMQSAEDKAFTQKALHYAFRADHGTGTGVVNILKNIQREQVDLQTGINEHILPCEDAGGIGPDGGAKVCARYDDSGVAAGVCYEGNGYRQLVFGFPLESALNFRTVYQTAVTWLLK